LALVASGGRLSKLGTSAATFQRLESQDENVYIEWRISIAFRACQGHGFFKIHGSCKRQAIERGRCAPDGVGGWGVAMNAAAAVALARCREILGYQRDEARGWWNDRLTLADQQAALQFAALPYSLAGAPWDALTEQQRGKLRAIHNRARAKYERLSHQFGGVA
jgi:hypothetical protein